MQQKIQKLIETNPKAAQIMDNALSYGGGGAMVTASTVADIADTVSLYGQIAQSVGFMLGCAILIVKLAHDIKKMFKK